jgi:hypothetical protein
LFSCQRRVPFSRRGAGLTPRCSQDILRFSKTTKEHAPNATYTMDPPSRSHIKRRAVSAQHIGTNLATNRISNESPSPLDPKSRYGHLGMEGQSVRSRNQVVSVGWIEGDKTMSRRTSSLQIELAECVETKTITTTTTTKRSYPPLLVRQPVDSLDPKEYPLALQNPPAELLSFRYEIDNASTSHSGDSNAKLVSNIPTRTCLVVLANELTIELPCLYDS